MSRPRTGSLTWIATPAPGHYRARLTLSDGTRPVVHLPAGLSPAKAQDMAEALASKSDGRAFKPGGPVGKTVDDLLDAWLPLVELDTRLAAATRYDHKLNSKKIRKAFGAMRPEELTPGVLRRWIRGLEALSASRIGRVWCTLGKLLDAAMGEEWIHLPANPCRHPGMKGQIPVVTPPDNIVTLDAAQIARLLVSPRRTRYLIALTSGLRDGEIAALTWADIRLERGLWVYDVNKNLSHHGAGRTKTRASKRLVPVHSAVVEALNLNGKTMHAAVLPTPLFPGHLCAPYRPPSAELIRWDLGLPNDSPVTFHALRRTFSTLLDKAEVGGETADRLLGHSSKSVRVRHYTATDLGRLREAVEAAWQPAWASATELPQATTAPSPILAEPLVKSVSSRTMKAIAELTPDERIPAETEGLKVLGPHGPNADKCADVRRGGDSVAIRIEQLEAELARLRGE